MLKALVFEFMRYVVVGGIAFVVDAGTLYLLKRFVLSGGSDWELFVCTALGFVAGLAVNYILSLVFVFKQKNNKNSGKSVAGFLIFAVVGLIGLGLTELGMYIGVQVWGWHVLITKVLVAGIVLVWNYAGRKIFVFGIGNGKGKQ